MYNLFNITCFHVHDPFSPIGKQELWFSSSRQILQYFEVTYLYWHNTGDNEEVKFQKMYSFAWIKSLLNWYDSLIFNIWVKMQRKSECDEILVLKKEINKIFADRTKVFVGYFSSQEIWKYPSLHLINCFRRFLSTIIGWKNK